MQLARNQQLGLPDFLPAANPTNGDQSKDATHLNRHSQAPAATVLQQRSPIVRITIAAPRSPHQPSIPYSNLIKLQPGDSSQRLCIIIDETPPQALSARALKY